MEQRPHADPYLESGRSVARVGLRERLLVKREALQRSISDADETERRAHAIALRCARGRLRIAAVIALTVPATVALALLAMNSWDGSYEGALTGSWSMLGFTICIGLLSFAWAWLSSLARLRETSQRLLTRAEYQRRLALLQLSEISHDAVR